MVSYVSFPSNLNLRHISDVQEQNNNLSLPYSLKTAMDWWDQMNIFQTKNKAILKNVSLIPIVILYTINTLYIIIKHSLTLHC